MTTVLLIFLGLFVIRAFNIAMGILFWNEKPEDMWSKEKQDRFGDISTVYGNFDLQTFPFIAEFAFIINIFCFTFYPLVLLAHSLNKFQETRNLKKSQEKAIKDRKAEIKRLQIKMLDDEIEEVKRTMKKGVQHVQ
jgi:hypothetical protein